MFSFYSQLWCLSNAGTGKAEERQSLPGYNVPSSSETPRLPFAGMVLSRAVNNLIIQVTSREQGKADYSFSIYP